MGCKTNWDLVIDRALPVPFLNGEWRKKRGLALMDAQKGLLHTAQAVARLDARKLEAKQQSVNWKLKVLEYEYLKNEAEFKEQIYRQLTHALRHGDAHEALFERLAAPIVEYKDRFKRVDPATTAEVTSVALNSKSQKRGKCPKDDCRGILDESFKCGLCSATVCSKCRVLDNQTDKLHVCSPADIESVNLLLKTSRPCPSCGTGIQRSEGCSHMFCTSCKTGFDWNSMKVIKDTDNTNPYLADYRRGHETVPDVQEDSSSSSSSAATPAAAVCVTPQESLSAASQHSTFSILECFLTQFDKTSHSEVSEETRTYISSMRELFANVRHLAFLEIPKLTARGGTLEEKTEAHMEKMRVDYLKNKISEDKWKDLVMRRDQQYQREKSIKNILDVWLITSGNLMRAAIADLNAIFGGRSDSAHLKYERFTGYYNYSVSVRFVKGTPPNPLEIIELDKTVPVIKELVSKLSNLRDYCLKDLKTVSYRYGCKVPSDIADNNYSTRYNLKGEPVGAGESSRKSRKTSAKSSPSAAAADVPAPMDIGDSDDETEEKNAVIVVSDDSDDSDEESAWEDPADFEPSSSSAVAASAASGNKRKRE